MERVVSQLQKIDVLVLSDYIIKHYGPMSHLKLQKLLFYYCCPLKVSEQRDIHPQCCCNGIADDFSEGKPLS